MGRARFLWRIAVAGLLLAACGVLAPPDPRFCSAAQSLSAAITLTETALEADAAGDVARAQGLATQARSLAEVAHGTLQEVPSERHSEAVWDALVNAYGQAGQASNALLPAFGYEPEMAQISLSSAEAALGRARADLPSMCFELPADLETPSPS